VPTAAARAASPAPITAGDGHAWLTGLTRARQSAAGRRFRGDALCTLSQAASAETRYLYGRTAVTTVRRPKLGTRVGVLDDASVVRLNRALVVFLGIASSVSSE
jgi:hypothetical protein